MAITPKISCLICFFCISQVFFSQEKEAGPVIADYGKVWKIDAPDLEVDKNKHYKAVFDIMTSPESHQSINPALETVARYLNMHAQSGIPVGQINAVAVVHNRASKDIMNHEAYRERYGTENPNYELVKQLQEAGVDIVFCGQSSYSRNIPRTNLIPEVKIALSAMTMLIELQDNGYRLIKF